MMTDTRCAWCGTDPLYVAFHDDEWGVPVHDDARLFEMLVLEGAQAGLSWITILKKRENYRKAFHGFDAQQVALYTPDRVEALMQDRGIVRNRLKLEGAVRTAKAVLAIQESFGSLDQYLWQFVDGSPIQNTWRSMSELPTCTTESDALSKDLKKRGCNFVGTTICYAFMQAVGMVNDHQVGCYRHAELANR